MLMSKITPGYTRRTTDRIWEGPLTVNQTGAHKEENSIKIMKPLMSLLIDIQVLLSVRMFTALLLCACFIALSITTSNLAGTMVCMFVPKPEAFTRIKRFMNESEVKKDFIEDLMWKIANESSQLKNASSLTPCQWSVITNAIEQFPKSEVSKDDETDPAHLARSLSDNVEVRPCYEQDPSLNWTSLQKGFVLAAQNVGSLVMLITGTQADRLNGKWTIVVALLISILSNILIPFLAAYSILLVILARILAGISDALMTPSINSMITRWFPPKERPFAIGFVTGGRQIGNLLILPVSGLFCSRMDHFGGWKPTFYVSAGVGCIILIIWLIFAADKPSKHFCISKKENAYILRKISEEALGKRKQRNPVPWRALLTSKPFIVAVFALVCHEYPLVIMISLLPTYLGEVLGVPDAANGFLSALPLLSLWLSKTLSSSLSSYLSARRHGCCRLDRTPLVKLFNAIASTGLGISLAIVPFLSHENEVPYAIFVMCTANAFAGLHTPGVQTALLQIAPAYTGIITGIAFSAVAIASIINKVTNGLILDIAAHSQWTVLFEISAAIALLPVVFFSIWGSADLQPWAVPTTRTPKTISQDIQFMVYSNDLLPSST
uniref:Major facilitator superfamily (MFS) profile domain-containing protein n=2 Tax=Parascaris univalens TaxID=6257 RepID=A0A914ZJI6_PARUN